MCVHAYTQMHGPTLSKDNALLLEPCVPSVLSLSEASEHPVGLGPGQGGQFSGLPPLKATPSFWLLTIMALHTHSKDKRDTEIF